MQVDELQPQLKRNWLRDWFRWSPTSAELLEQAEKKIFSYLKKPYNLEHVSIPSKDGAIDEHKIRSLVINADSDSTPLVLLHGFASGIGLWVLNLNTLSQDRPVYALDILGFGRSSRPSFSKDAEQAEMQFIESIELWRQQIGLEKFILLGHSMGGFLAASYALQYPDRIKHLILADPWGFPVPNNLSVKRIEIPFWAKIIATMLQPFNPLAGLRIAGPWGPQLVERFRPDILKKFEPLIDEPKDVSNYIYHCNAQVPSGESAFKAMTAQFGWAKRPMKDRILQLRSDIPMTFIYGSRSWIDSQPGIEIQAVRDNSFVDIKSILGAGHHVYADKAEEFNKMVQSVCKEDGNIQSNYLAKQANIHQRSKIVINATNEANVPATI